MGIENSLFHVKQGTENRPQKKEKKVIKKFGILNKNSTLDVWK